ncbi:MAG: hypothetical protein HWE27_15800 [Gammaproteobacteria bacterium]|uniref:hypothetical protein n=1 Tax=Vibrio hepatarius TaxID=171383 RepID=UPI00148D99B6|nr:hypothetical protein [Vibrio hepatarius]NOI14406.1 hypothetical protein [Vibrio hepatarius]NVJ61856.1 hypothetical protein [Gammaproteobacteria bacterium]
MFKKTLIATSAALLATSTFAADIDNTNLDIAFQGAHFQGAGNQISMLRVPVTNKDTGETQFFDMSAQFAADKNGNLIFKNISSVKSVAFASANQLVAGHYLDTDNCSWFVEGPSVTSNGRLSWSFFKPANNIGCSNSYSRNGQVLSGPLENNQLAVTLDSVYKKIIKTSESNLNYGVYRDSYILSAVQVGQSIAISIYDSSGLDGNWTIRQAPYPGKKED